jgi:hypothetical protein
MQYQRNNLIFSPKFLSLILVSIGIFFRNGHLWKDAYIGFDYKHGIMQRWNSGFSKDIIHFKLYRHADFFHLPNTAAPRPIIALKLHCVLNIPPFQWGQTP